MKYILILLIPFMLVACGNKTAVESIGNSIQNSINNQNNAITKLEQELPEECKIPEVMAEITALKIATTNIQLSTDAIVKVCETEKSELNTKIKNRELFIGFLTIILLAMLGYKIANLIKERNNGN